MADLSTVAVLFRLLVAGVAIVGPTLLFLGFWRGLVWLRDDALVERLAARGVVESPSPSAVDVLATATASHPGASQCDDCGASNLPAAHQCRECGSRL